MPKLQAYADEKSKCDPKIENCFEKGKNIVKKKKRENGGYQRFLFSHGFSKT